MERTGCRLLTRPGSRCKRARGRSRCGPLGLCVVVLGTFLALPGAASAVAVKGDFNGDGRADLAAGVPYEDVGTVGGAGAVNVLYGTAGGLSSTGNQFWHQNSPGVLGAAEADDDFGFALAAGDFNGDGRADLAVGIPGEDVGTHPNAGQFAVLYGTASGLSASGNQLWQLATPGDGDHLGRALAAGDFNGDGRADLASGAPTRKVGTVGPAGAVYINYGSASGLSGPGNQWSQNSTGVLDAAENGDGFGFALVAGDFNGNGRADLAVGVDSEDVGTVAGAGAVNVLYGTAAGLSSTGNQFWHQNSPSVLDAAEDGENFGFALAARDFNGNLRADLAVGVPSENLAGVVAGAVNVLYGTAGGLSSTGNQFWHQNSAGVLDAAEDFDEFGIALAAGDFNGNLGADLAVGVRDEGVVTPNDGAGAVNVLYGGAGGLSSTGNQFWHQNSPGVLDAAEDFDEFGSALTPGDFNGSGPSDLAVGVETEDVGTVLAAGAVNVLYSGAGGLSSTGNQFWHQNSPGVLDAAEGFDSFGLAVG